MNTKHPEPVEREVRRRIVLAVGEEAVQVGEAMLAVCIDNLVKRPITAGGFKERLLRRVRRDAIDPQAAGAVGVLRDLCTG